MHSESGGEQEDERLTECLVRFEHMLAHDDQYYFDVADLEELIDHYMERLDIDKAWKVLELASNQHPHSREFELKRADILGLKGDYEGAMKSIARLEAIMPNNPDMLITKGSLYSKLGKHNKAIEIYNRALETAENKNDVRLLLSFEFQSLGNQLEALSQLKMGLLNSPNDQGLIYEISFLFDMMGENDSAIAFFTKYLDEHPYQYNAWYNLATFYIKKRDFKTAIWALEFTLAVSDKHLMAHQEIGDCFLEIDKWDKAEEHFNEVLKIDEDNPDALIGIAECSEGREDFELAFKRYKDIADTDAFHAEAWYGMAVVREKQERYDECLPYIEKALEIDATDPEYWTFLADLKEQGSQFEEAIEALEKAGEIAPEDVTIWIAKAELVFNHVDRQLGIEVLMEALKISPENAELHYRQSALLLASGQVSEALHFLQNGLELDYNKHILLFEQFPDAINIPRVMDLIQIYGQ